MAKSGTHSFAFVEPGTPDVETAITVDSLGLPANIQLTEDESGAVFDTLIGLQSISPVMSITTKSVSEALQKIGLQGGCLKSDGTLKELIQYYESKVSCGSTAGVNLGYKAAAGYYRLGTLTASRGQEATLTIDVDTLSGDGAVAPIVQVTGATLPTTINTDSFSLGIPQVAGLSFPEATQVTLNFGVTLTDKPPGWGSIYPTDVGLQKVRPEIRIENADLDMLKAAGVPLDSKEATHANTILPFRKKKNRGAFVDDATAEHFSITASGLFYFDTIASGSGNSNASNTLVLRAVKESATAPIVFSFDEVYAG